MLALVVAKSNPHLIASTNRPESTAQESPGPSQLPSKPEDLRHGILVLYNGQSALNDRQAGLTG